MVVARSGRERGGGGEGRQGEGGGFVREVLMKRGESGMLFTFSIHLSNLVISFVVIAAVIII